MRLSARKQFRRDICSGPQLRQLARPSTKGLLLISLCRSYVVHGFVSAHKQTVLGTRAGVRLKTNFVNLQTAAAVFGFLTPLSAGTVSAADLHPIIEIETGYFFGASENEKWVKADQAAKSVGNKTTYQVYSLTQQVAQITA